MVLIKTFLIATLLAICYQDIKERSLYWFLPLVMGVFIGILFYQKSNPDFFITSVLLNVFVVSTIFLMMAIYVHFKMKTTLSETIGMGDIIFIYLLAMAFSTISFVVLLISSFIFSLLVHLVFKNKSKFNSVPLAGYMSLFFAVTFLADWSGLINSLYII